MVVMPAYRAEKTLEATWRDLPHDVVGHVLVVDDGSDDDTVAVINRLGIEHKHHSHNRGYGVRSV